MHLPGRPTSFLRKHSLGCDAVLAVAAFPWLLLTPDPDHHVQWADNLGIGIWLTALLTAVVFAFRRRSPIPSAYATLAGTAVLMASQSNAKTAGIVCMISAFSVSTIVGRRAAVVFGIVTSIVLGVIIGRSAGNDPFSPEVFGIIAWTAMSVAIGDAVRSKRAWVAAIEERARRAEETREEEALRRVAEERLHIARELHDVIAHHIAVVNVQAGAASHLLNTDPAGANEALVQVRRASRTILDELTAMLQVLRRPGDAENATAPAPSLTGLTTLLDSFRSVGLDVSPAITGDISALPPTVDFVAYRVIQEALTNAHKHGNGNTHLAIAVTPSALDIVVTNDTSEATAPSENGYGLIGMHERAGAVGGTVTAGMTNETQYRVSLTVPLHEESRNENTRTSCR